VFRYSLTSALYVERNFSVQRTMSYFCVPSQLYDVYIAVESIFTQALIGLVHYVQGAIKHHDVRLLCIKCATILVTCCLLFAYSL